MAVAAAIESADRELDPPHSADRTTPNTVAIHSRTGVTKSGTIKERPTSHIVPRVAVVTESLRLDDVIMRIAEGAANDVRLRLEALDMPPAIAIAMGQAAYMPSRNRIPGLPSPIVGRAEAAWLISKYEEQLGIQHDPSAKVNLVQGLCVRIFGNAGEVLFTSGYPSATAEHESEAMAQRALRYFDTVDLSFLGDQVMIPATYVSGEGQDERRWDGILLTKDGLIGFFEESDLLVEDVSQGSPILAHLGGLQRCSILMPSHPAPGITHIDHQGASNHFVASLQFDDGKRMRFAVWLEPLPPTLRDEAMEGISELLRIFDKALAFSQQSRSKSNIASSEESKPATDSRPAIRIPDLGDARSLPAFSAAMDEMTSRYLENGNNPRMLWPLLDQYLQPMLYRHSLRTYMTSDEVTGYWLIEKYVSYAGQSLTLLQLGNHHLQRGELGASEHAALKDFILTSTQEMYALVICAVQTVGKERPICVDGSPLELGGDLFANLTSKLNEIVSAQDPNDPIRWAQQVLKSDGDP